MRRRSEFALKKARVRTFKRLENIFSLCVLAYVCATQLLGAWCLVCVLAYVCATQLLRRTKGFRKNVKCKM